MGLFIKANYIAQNALNTVKKSNHNMTKKDYELIADKLSIIVKCSREIENLSQESWELKYAMLDKSISQMIYFLITALEEDNPRFDRERFMKAVNKI